MLSGLAWTIQAKRKSLNPSATELNPICNYDNLGSCQSVYTQL
jgi:hypothetical protein